ncbi:MAG: family 16 glycosylhydrolase [Fibrobacter sp.]|nr:family 16 glycosylhydrolase [Fibrobacter sp.]
MVRKLLLAAALLTAIPLASFAQQTKQYNGAELYSLESVKYGRFDVRMKTIAGSGTVSSFFTYYNESYVGSPEPWREIDIEVLGKSTSIWQSNIITGNAASKVTSEGIHNFANLNQEYHTYSVEWTPDYIAWFFDGQEIRRTTGQQVTDCQTKNMSYRFNLWISDVPEWVGAFNESILPVYQYINWMTYSEYTPGRGPNGSNFTQKWRDDFDSFNSSRWGKGDWTFDGNLVDFHADNIVMRDGYCILCLTKSSQKGFNGTIPKDNTSHTKKSDKTSYRPYSIFRGDVNNEVTQLNGKMVTNAAALKLPNRVQVSNRAMQLK